MQCYSILSGHSAWPAPGVTHLPLMNIVKPKRCSRFCSTDEVTTRSLQGYCEVTTGHYDHRFSKFTTKISFQNVFETFFIILGLSKFVFRYVFSFSWPI